MEIQKDYGLPLRYALEFLLPLAADNGVAYIKDDQSLKELVVLTEAKR